MGVDTFGIIYSYLKMSCPTWIVDLWYNNITTRNQTFCPTPHGVILTTDCEARG